MPFGFLRRRPAAAETTAEAVPAADAIGPRSGIPFEGLTEDWRLVGTLTAEGRLLDALNHRGSLAVTDIAWRPADGSEPYSAAPGIRSVDPYDLIVVAVTPDSLPPQTPAEHAAHLVHRIPYDVALEVPPYRVLGSILLHPGMDPDRLLDRSTQLFIPVTRPTVLRGAERIDLADDVDAVLVNRLYLRGVTQIDLATGVETPSLSGGRPIVTGSAEPPAPDAS